MTEQRMLTAAGADQPGILDELSRFILDRGGNIRDARVMNLRGHFAMLILIEATAAQMSTLVADVAAVAERSRVDVHIGSVIPNGDTHSIQARYQLTASGHDRTGLVNKLSHLLRALSINMESLDTHVAPGKAGNAATFELTAQLSVPPATPLIKLREYLDHLFVESAVRWELGPSVEVG